MKPLLLLLAILFAVNFSYAQWTTSGSNTTTTNNVGIGTAGPSAPLHITKSASGDIGPRIILENTASAAVNNAAELSFLLHYGTSSSSYNASIKAFEENSSGHTSISFGTYGGSAAPSERMRITSQGNVGIGTTSPAEKLNVIGNIRADGIYPYLNLYSSSWSANSYIQNGVDQVGLSAGNYLTFLNPSGKGFAFSAGVTNIMTIDTTGNVAIGTINSQGHKLAVNGDIIAAKVIVMPHSSWPDYVFKPQYNLPALSDVKTYIDKNQHLPDMPSAAEIAKDGQDIGEINKVLLKKVEELTLYMIEKDREIKEMKNSQQKQIDDLKAQMGLLKQK